MEHANVSSCLEEWGVLDGEYQTLEGVNKQYQQKLDELHHYQERCLKGIAHQKYRAKLISQSMKHLGKTASEEDKIKMHKLEKEIIKRKVGLNDMEEYLPRKNGRYLRIILGSVNVSLMNRAERYNYKDEYEKFKMIVTAIGFIMSFLSLMVNYRFMDLSIIFLLVWYYCTLTIRESILKINGSKIKGWWRTHHFLSTVASGVLLIWPDSESYTQFRHQFLIFNCYIALVQFLQFRYQQGCLYRLKALGERHNMDITIEGFHSWMWRGLSFLLPFLFIGYFYQLYNAYTLYKLSQEPYCKEWQVKVLSGLFLALFMGNVITTSVIVPQKLKEKLILKYRFPRFMKRKNGQPSSQMRSFDNDKETPSSPSEPKKDN